MTEESVLSVRGLQTHFGVREGLIRAVDGVDFEIRRGRTPDFGANLTHLLDPKSFG